VPVLGEPVEGHSDQKGSHYHPEEQLPAPHEVRSPGILVQPELLLVDFPLEGCHRLQLAAEMIHASEIDFVIRGNMPKTTYKKVMTRRTRSTTSAASLSLIMEFAGLGLRSFPFSG